MEESKKKQLKAFGKAMLYVLGIGISLCAGLVLGKCSADSAHKNQIIVRADSPDIDYSSISNNYFDSAVHYPDISLVFDTAGSPWDSVRLIHQNNATYSIYCLDLNTLPSGLYFFHLSPSDSPYSVFWGYCTSAMENYFHVYSYATEGSNITITRESGLYEGRSWVDAVDDMTWKFATTDVGWRYLFVRMPATIRPYLVLANTIDVPSSEIVTFSKNNWYPYQLLGTNNTPVVRGPTWSNIGAQQTIDLDNIVFRSNGMVFTEIRVWFSPLGIYGSEASTMGYPTTYGYFSNDMEIIWVEKVNTHDLWYISQVDYISYDNVQHIVGHQRRKQYDDGSTGAVSQYFDWISSAYATIEMIDWSDSINSNVSTGLMSSYDWIKAVASSVTSTPEVYYDGMSPFTLLGDAFHSLDSLLGIHILPMISIGTLIFTPLILVVIMAIIKILNK